MDAAKQVADSLQGKRYTKTVPDTLDLQDRAKLALNALGGAIDPELLTIYGHISLHDGQPHMKHWASADTLLDPKFLESFSLMRVICGDDAYTDLEAKYRDAVYSRVDNGLYWDRYSPERPWRNSYAPAYYGNGKDEDFATLPGTARLLRTLTVCHQLGDQSAELEEMLRSVIHGLNRIAICRNDYCYYPEHGGWGEPCSYPRSGWLNTDEAQSDTEGGEGSVICMHGHQIYGAARWYAISGDSEAMELARKLTNYCIQPKFWGGVPDLTGGKNTNAPNVASPDPDPPYTSGFEQGHWYSHFHARAIALRGMLEYALVANDERVAEFVRRAYEYTLTQGIPRMGWINCYPDAANAMEGCALGDLAGLAVKLTDAGLGDYWDDLDALVRNQLVEQQFVRRDILERVMANLPDKEHAFQPKEATFENIIDRMLGSYAGFGLPDCAPSVWVMHCCTANATQGLYYAWEGIIRENGDRATVNLFLNRASKLVDVESHLPFEGKVVIRNKRARRIAVRIPAWVDKRQLTVEVSGRSVDRPDWIGRYLLFTELESGDVVTLCFPLKETHTTYTINYRSPAEKKFTCTFRGSTVVDISPREVSPLAYPFYERCHMRKDAAPTRTIRRFVPERVVTG